jgi:streptogramin lyase
MRGGDPIVKKCRYFALALLMQLLLGLNAPQMHGETTTTKDSSGTDFWVAFISNLSTSGNRYLYITGDTDTTGTVTIPGVSTPTSFSVTAGQVTTVNVPTSAGIPSSSSDSVGSLGIHIVSGSNVTVYGLNYIAHSTDAFLALPTSVLGEEYLVMAFPTTINNYGSQFAIVGTADGTTVTITPKTIAGSRAAGTTYTITLNQGQTYELQAPTLGQDVTGTLITSTQPIAVYGGSACSDVPSSSYAACNHLVEQLPPTSAWGKAFYTEPLATRLKGDTFRFLASVDNTTVSVNGSVVTTLNRGEAYLTNISTSSIIMADQPILVAQYSNGTNYDGVSADPFMMIVPPYEQYLLSYTVTTPSSGYAPNYVNIIAPTAGLSSLKVDGTAVSSSLFTQINSSSYSGGQIPVSVGSHHLSASVPFGVISYGFASADGYGYVGGFSLSPVASVSSVSVGSSSTTASTGSQACMSATVDDKNGNGLSGIRVDFVVTGANSESGSATTDSAGTATYCYTGTNDGTDTITATVSSTSGSSVVTWSSQPATATATVLTTSSSEIAAGSSLTLTATITPAPTGSSLGTVSFYNGSTLLGTASVNSSGIAKYTTSNLAAGTASLSAVYSGTSLYTTSTSSTTSVTVDSYESSPVATSATTSATFTISAGTTVGSIAVVTQGSTDLDFTNAGTGTCAASTYSTESTCTVNVTATPKYPGLRYGAVELLDSDGNVIQTQYVSVMGTASLVGFSPATQTTLGGDLSLSNGVAVDAAGNVYVADTAHNAVEKIAKGCTDASCVTTLGGGFSAPSGIAIDGAGNVLVTDTGNTLVKKIPGNCTTSSCVTTLGGTFQSLAGITVDGGGNIYVGDAANNVVVKIPSSCTSSSCTSTLGGGLNAPHGIAVDATGSVYVADYGNSAVKVIANSCTSATCVTTLGGGISQPVGIALDAAGSVYVSDLATSSIKKIASTCTSSDCVSSVGGTFITPKGLAMGSDGKLYIGDSSNTAVSVLDFSSPSTMSFPATLVGSISSTQAMTVSNNGNSVLTFASSGLLAPTDFKQTEGGGTLTDCASGGSVAAGANCNLSLIFAPTVTGSPLSESFVLTDNSDAISNATQSITLSGSSTSPIATITPTITLSATGNQSMLGSEITLTAQASSSSGTPTGTISFLDGTTPIGTATLSDGVASLSVSSLSAGAHTITAVYSGDSIYITASSSALSETVIDFSTTVNTGSGSTTTSGDSSVTTVETTVTPGGTATVTLSVLPGNGVTSLPVVSILTITGMPNGATATVNPTTWAQTANTRWTFPANVTLSSAKVSIQVPTTTSSAMSADRYLLGRRFAPHALGMLLLPFARRIRRTGRRMSKIVSVILLMLASLVATAGLSACGSTNGFFSQGAKSYDVRITVTSGSVSRSTNMTLTVQ